MLCCVHCTVDAVHGVHYTVHLLVHCNILPHFKEAVPWNVLNSRFFILTMFSWRFSNNYLTEMFLNWYSRWHTERWSLLGFEPCADILRVFESFKLRPNLEPDTLWVYVSRFVKDLSNRANTFNLFSLSFTYCKWAKQLFSVRV